MRLSIFCAFFFLSANWAYYGRWLKYPECISVNQRLCLSSINILIFVEGIQDAWHYLGNSKNGNSLSPRVTLPNSEIIFKDNPDISLFHNQAHMETCIGFISDSYCDSRTLWYIRSVSAYSNSDLDVKMSVISSRVES